MTEEVKKPRVNSESKKELDKLEKQFDAFDKSVKDMTLDHMNKAPVQVTEQQTKIDSKTLEKTKDFYLKPLKSIGSREKFNEDYRKDYEFAKEYVHFVAENKEIIGETIKCWTKHFAGVPCEYWEVPVNVPVWGPRYLAEQIKGCKYHRLIMTDKATSNEGNFQYYGSMAADTTIQRLDAHPVTTKRSVFMGATNF